MDPADAADGKRRTQAWGGPPGEPSTPARALRWVPGPASPGHASPGPAPASIGALPSYPQAPQPSTPPTNQRAPGVIVGGRYRLLRSLGRGALTETWEASHVDLERSVAIKFSCESAVGIAERMVEEARVIARIRHPHVIEFSDFGRTATGEPFFVMELLTGQTVEQLLARRGAIPWARAVAIIQQVGEALGAAHQHGIVHRDLRPGNVFLVDTGQVGDFVKVVDFGLARGTTLGGTPSYMSPEQCRGEQLDPRSDVYAMGCLLFAMITGDPPFTGDPQRVICKQLNEAPKALRERAPRQFIPDELDAIIARCMAKLPAQRFADTRELAAELAALAQFSAAASMVGSTAHDSSASGSRPMGYAGRPPPQSPRELTNSYKPVNQPIIDDDPDEPPAAVPVVAPVTASGGMSVPAIVGAALLVVAGIVLGSYWLAKWWIATDTEHREPSAQPINEAASESSEPPRERAPTEAKAAVDEPPAPAPAVVPMPDPESAAPESAVPESEVVAPSKKPASKAQPREASPSEPAPEPAPAEPAEPAKKKPSAEPDSKAKDKIGHDELRDPWG